MPNPVRPFLHPPFVDDPNLREWINWVHQSITQLQGAANPPNPKGGLLTALPSTIDPTTAQILSKGARVGSVTSKVVAVATTTTITVYWDGTNGSDILTIYRDDATQIGPTLVGSPQVISGLSANTKYFLYPYWDDGAQRVKFAVGDKTGVGTPPFAFTSQNLKAVQQTILAGNVPLAILFATTGATTPNSGSSTISGGSGGGGAGGGAGGYKV